MRWLCLALLCNPVALLADGLSLGQIDLHDLLAVSDALSHEGNLSDERVLLLLDENRTAADLVTIVTDPKTGYVAGIEALSAIVPVSWPRLEGDLYVMSQATQADGNEHLRLEASNAERSATLVLDRKDGGWVIISATFYRRDDEFACRIEAVEDGGFSEHVSANQREVETGRRDTIAPFWWETGLMRMCFN